MSLPEFTAEALNHAVENEALARGVQPDTFELTKETGQALADIANQALETGLNIGASIA